MQNQKGIISLIGIFIAISIPSPAASNPCQTDDKFFTATPCTASLGTTTKVVIRRDTTLSGDPLQCATVEPQGSKVTVSSPFVWSQSASNDFLTGSVQVDAAAPVGVNFLLLKTYALVSSACPNPLPATPSHQELVPFSIAALPPPGAIPTAGPVVDISWKVLPRTVTSDNFGARVAKLYYAIVVYIGNNAGYDLQLAGVYFELPTGSNLQTPIPVDPYRIVRGSLQHEQIIGLRNTTVNVVKGIGPILTAATPFFSGSTAAARNHKTNFQTFTGLFTNPFATGLELVFPDLTVNQLVALDNQALRDSVIVNNNTSVPLLVFVDKGLLAAGPNASVITNGRAATDAYTANLNANKKLLNSAHKSDHDPVLVMRELGQIKLIGQQIDYINRVTLTSKAPAPVPAPSANPPASAVANPATPQTLARLSQSEVYFPRHRIVNIGLNTVS